MAHTQLAERAKELLGISVEPPPGAGIVGPQAVPEEALPPEEGLPPEAPPESDLPIDVPAGGRPPEGGTSPELVPGEDVAGPAVPPDAPRTGEVPPRTGEFPPIPSSEPPPRS